MIYFLRCGGFIKIGVSNNPWKRVKQVQIGSPENVDLLFVMDGNASTEAELHKEFVKYHHRGEWFKDEMLDDPVFKVIVKSSKLRLEKVCPECDKPFLKPYFVLYCSKECYNRKIDRMILARFPHRREIEA